MMITSCSTKCVVKEGCFDRTALQVGWQYKNVLLKAALIHSIGKSPSWAGNIASVSQDIPCILWNLKVHCSAHNCPPLVPISSQIKSDPAWHIIHKKNFQKPYIHARVDVIANFDIHFHSFSYSKACWQFEVNLQGTEHSNRLWRWESQPHTGWKGKGPERPFSWFLRCWYC